MDSTRVDGLTSLAVLFGALGSIAGFPSQTPSACSSRLPSSLPWLIPQLQITLNPEGASEADLKKRTLTNLYNEHPTWLTLLHRRLDHAVLDAYGWPHDLTDDEILARLLALNLERAAASTVLTLPA